MHIPHPMQTSGSTLAMLATDRYLSELIMMQTRSAAARAAYVLLSEDDCENLIETLNLLLIPGFRESIKRSTDQVVQNPKSGKRLVGDLKGFFSISLSYRDRIVYSIDKKTLSMCIEQEHTMGISS